MDAKLRGDRVDYIGPFDVTHIVVEGRGVPFLEATPQTGGKILLSLDHRFGLELSVADAERVVPFIADCIAVALGFTCHPGDGSAGSWRPSEPLRSNPFRRSHSVRVSVDGEPT